MNSDALRMPAEWEPQAFIQLTWPHADTDWQPILEEITETYVEMARAITDREGLLIVHPRPEEVRTLLTTRLTPSQMSCISFFACETNDTWARDHGFISLERGERKEERGEEKRGEMREKRGERIVQDGEYHLLDFCFNGWGEKFEAGLDNAINGKLFQAQSKSLSSLLSPLSSKTSGSKQTSLLSPLSSLLYSNHLDFVLEGGSIESDGEGTIFTTRCCLLAPHRNQPLTEAEIDAELKRRLHAERIVWLDCEPMTGDDTDGHIDTIVRIAPDNILLFNRTGDDSFSRQLQSLRTLDGHDYRLLELPVPAPIYDEDGEQLPATYANFLILNGAVLVPTYDQPENDREAVRIIQSAFPDREMVPIDSRSIIKQHGSIHCCTMQFFR